MDTVLVFVIAGVIIAAIAGATLSGDPKPPTTSRRRRRGPAPAHGRRPAPGGPVPSAPSTPDVGDLPVLPAPPEHPDPPVAAAPPPPVPFDPPWLDEPDAEDDLAAGEIDEPRRWRRLRSGALLMVTVVVLGSLAAGLLGAVVLLGYRALDRALG